MKTLYDACVCFFEAVLIEGYLQTAALLNHGLHQSYFDLMVV